MDESGKDLADSECQGKDKSITRSCNAGHCAEWTTGNWLGVSYFCDTFYDSLIYVSACSNIVNGNDLLHHNSC